MLIAERRVSGIMPAVAPPGVRLRFSEDTWVITGIRQETVAGRPVLVVDTALAWDEERKPVDITAAIETALKAMDAAAARLRSERERIPEGGYYPARALIELAQLVIARDRLRAVLAPPEAGAGQWFAVTERDEKQRRQEFIDGLKRDLGRARDRIQQLLAAGDRLDKAIGGNADEIMAAVQNWRAITAPPKPLKREARGVRRKAKGKA